MRYVLARRLLPLAVIAAAVLGGGGIAGAVIPDSNGTVHGCIKINTGGLYLIDTSAGQACGKDSALDWNETGATGTRPGATFVATMRNSATIETAHLQRLREAL